MIEVSYERIKPYEENRYDVRMPISEVLQEPASSRELFEGVVDDIELLIKQIEHRRVLSKAIRKILDLLEPCQEISTLIFEKQASELDIENFYIALGDLLSGEYRRLLLYLPFELLPSLKMAVESEGAESAIRRFIGIYREAWFSLLGELDVRANFVDGDVMEVEYREGDLPRVPKVLHLAPGLLEKGILLRSEVDELATCDGEIGMCAKQMLELSELRTCEAENNTSISVPDVLAKLRVDILRAEQAVYDAPTPRRCVWLKDKATNKIISECVGVLTNADLGNGFREILGMFTDPDWYVRRVCLDAAVSIVVANSDIKKYIQLLKSLELAAASLGMDDDLKRAYRQIYEAEAISERFMSARGIPVGVIDGSYLENLVNMVDVTERANIMLGHIAEDELLSEHLYPVALLYGSRVKGYGVDGSDQDVAILIRPQTPQSERDQIRDRLKHHMNDDEFEPIEFWLEEEDSGLVVADISDHLAGDKYWVHMFSGALWMGNHDEIVELQRSILPQYFRTNDGDRRYYLERLEQDVIQYRLLHKGFNRIFVRSERPKWTTSRDVDGDGAFWDPRFRQLATKLFVDRVFLPGL